MSSSSLLSFPKTYTYNEDRLQIVSLNQSRQVVLRTYKHKLPIEGIKKGNFEYIIYQKRKKVIKSEEKYYNLWLNYN